MIKLKSILNEADSIQSNTFKMYHGGRRWEQIPTELYSSKQGRYECGVGIYFTNHYNTARKYAKGSKVVHLVEIDRNFVDIEKVKIPFEDVVNFVKNAYGMKHKKEIINDLTGRWKTSEVPAFVLNNLIVNYEAGSGKVGIEILKYFLSKGIDASVIKRSNDENWLVVFNPRIIKSVKVVNPTKLTKDDYKLPPILTV